jgi:hypothetical protein
VRHQVIDCLILHNSLLPISETAWFNLFNRSCREECSVKRTFAIRLGLAGLMSCAAMAITTTADAAQPAISNSSTGWICTRWISNPPGTVCINAESKGYDAKYSNDSSTSHVVDFNLVRPGKPNIGDQGAFTAAPGSTHTYFFATGNLGCAQVYVYARVEGWTIFSNLESVAGRC